jgi:hypothetical protein
MPESEGINNFKEVSISPNGRLQKLVIEGVSNLEGGLKIIGENLDFSEIKIQILGADAVGRLVIVEVSDKEEESVFFKVVDHFDWVFNHTEEIRRKFTSFNIDVSLSPRVIIIMPGFSQALVRRMGYLNRLDLKLYSYRIIDQGGPQNVKFELVSFASQRKFIKDLEERTVDELLDYIEIPAVRILCQKAMSEIKRLFPQVKIITSSGYLSFKSNDNELFGLYPQRNFFWFNSSKSTWHGFYVNSLSGLEKINEELKSNRR